MNHVCEAIQKYNSKILANSLKAYEPEELKDDQPQPLQRQLQSPGVNGNANSAADQDGYMGEIAYDPARGRSMALIKVDEMVVRERQPPNLQATAATPNSNSGSRTNSLSTNTQSTEFAAATPSSTTYESDSTRAIENLQQINDL
jgi:hypothetical protein